MKVFGEVVSDVVIFFVAAIIASGACSAGKAGTCGKSKAAVQETARSSY